MQTEERVRQGWRIDQRVRFVREAISILPERDSIIGLKDSARDTALFRARAAAGWPIAADQPDPIVSPIAPYPQPRRRHTQKQRQHRDGVESRAAEPFH